MPTIRIDADVYAWLRGHAEPFVDTPNSVLRRIAGLTDQASAVRRVDAPTRPEEEDAEVRTPQPKDPTARRRAPRLYGRDIARRHRVDVNQALYHHEGTFYHLLNRFPAALFDGQGYVYYQTAHDYENDSDVNIGSDRLHVRRGIQNHPRYQRLSSQ
jgi:hypothetical protein